MTKDDYFVIVYKILSYLYIQLKAGEDIDERLISYDSPLLNINKKYWYYIMENLAKDGYITCDVINTWGGITVFDLKTVEITPAGIAYVSDNTLFERVKEFLKGIKEITPFI